MKIKKLCCFVLFLLIFSGCITAIAGEPQTATIFFTHDLHSHLLPAIDESGNSYGGYARLKTIIEEQKEYYPDAVLLDGGDFSMGTLFQTIYSSDAAELRIMGALGYDVTTFGNHEYDYRAEGLAKMLLAASASGETVPQIVESNYLPPKEDDEGYHSDSAAVWDAFQTYGVKDYTVIPRGGINYAVFGMVGLDSDACAPMSGMILHDIESTAQEMVKRIEAEVPEPRLIVCLSHSGTSEDNKKSEDYQLASKVDGIDVIISGHTHSTLEEPLVVNDTYIVSGGEYSKNLGVLQLECKDGSYTLSDYQLIPIHEDIPADPFISSKIDEYGKLVETNYLSQFGDLGFNEVLAHNPYTFESISDLDQYHQETNLGNLIADSYKWAVEQAEGEDGAPIDFALTANGVIRESFSQGDITVEQVFNALSLGIGADQIPGYPLVAVYITGKDLKNAFEVDASVTDLMPAAQLYFSGMTFTFNPHRMIFNKVTDCGQFLNDGTIVPIEDERLYRVVTGLYCGQMLGAVNGKSFGILNITPRDAQGNEITNLEDCIIHTANGSELKEWYALASYLQSLETLPETYSQPQGRKIMNDSWNPIELLKNPNAVTLTVLGVVIVLIVLMIGIFMLIRTKMRTSTIRRKSH